MKSIPIVKQDKTHGVHVRSVDIWQGLGYAEHRVLKQTIDKNIGVLGELTSSPLFRAGRMSSQRAKIESRMVSILELGLIRNWEHLKEIIEKL